MPAGLRGLRPLDPAKHARFRSALEYGFTFAPPTYPITKAEGISAWGMDGNGPDPTLTANGGQPVGDCGPCAVPAHADMLTAVLVGADLAANTMTSDQVVNLYFAYTSNQDVGVDLGDWLLWLFNQGLIEGFVKIDLPDLDSALATFDVIVVGVSLNPQADAQVNNGAPWDVGPGDEPDPNEGHAILYLSADSPSGPFGWCTWGQVQSSTLAWKQACPQQAFAVLTKVESEAKGFPFAELVADLKALGGTVVDPPTPVPIPTPPPVPEPPAPPSPPPTPEPPPVPTPPPAPGLLQEIEADVEEVVDKLEDLAEDVVHLGEPKPAFGPGVAQLVVDSVSTPGETALLVNPGTLEQDNTTPGVQATVRRTLAGDVIHESIHGAPKEADDV